MSLGIDYWNRSHVYCETGAWTTRLASRRLHCQISFIRLTPSFTTIHFSRIALSTSLLISVDVKTYGITVAYEEYNFLFQENVTCEYDYYFQCADNLECVDPGFECDKYADCADGSDEHSSCLYFDCGDGRFINAEWFKSYKKQCTCLTFWLVAYIVAWQTGWKLCFTFWWCSMVNTPNKIYEFFLFISCLFNQNSESFNLSRLFQKSVPNLKTIT